MTCPLYWAIQSTTWVEFLIIKQTQNPVITGLLGTPQTSSGIPNIA